MSKICEQEKKMSEDKLLAIARKQAKLISLYQTLLAKNPMVVLSADKELTEKVKKLREEIEALKR